MNKFAVTAFVSAFVISPAFASDLESHCTSYAESNGTDPAGCTCLVDLADDDMAEELLEVETPDDLEFLSEDSIEAIQECWPDA